MRFILASDGKRHIKETQTEGGAKVIEPNGKTKSKMDGWMVLMM